MIILVVKSLSIEHVMVGILYLLTLFRAIEFFIKQHTRTMNTFWSIVYTRGIWKVLSMV